MILTPAIETGAAMDAAGSASAAAGPGPWATLAPGKGEPEGWLSAANGSADASQPLSGESFSASWQSVLRAWGMTGVVAQRAGNTAATGTRAPCEPGAEGATRRYEGAADLRVKISQSGTGTASRSMTATGKENGSGATLPATGEIGKSAATMAHTASGQQRIRAYAAEVLTSEQSTDAPAGAGTVMDRKSASELAAGAARDRKSEKAASALGEAKAPPQAGTAGAAAIVPPGDGMAAAAAPVQAENLPARTGSAPDSKIEDRVVTADAVRVDAEATATALATSTWNKFPVYGGPAAPGTATQIGTGSRSVGHNAEAASQRAPLSSEADAATVTRSESGEKAAEPPSAPGPVVRAGAGQSRNVEASERSGQAANAAGRESKTPATEAGTHRKLAASNASIAEPAAASAGRPTVESSDPSAQLAAARAAHEGTRVEASAAAPVIGPHLAALQVPAASDAAAWVRDAAGAHGTLSAAAASGSAGTPATARETFAALDSGLDTRTAVGTSSWVHAGGQRAEAGFEDPALGWVSVRADMSGGSVHAAVVPGSADAAQALSGHMAGLSAYLAEEHAPVATLTMAHPYASTMDASVGQNPQQGSGGEQSSAAAPQNESQPSTITPAAASATASRSGFESRPDAATGRGVHISVMA
jgi:hypothetical protein